MKSEHFHSHFTTHALFKNSSKLPKLNYETKNRFNSFAINGDEIFLIIKNLDVNKGHGWYDMSIWIIRLSGKTIVISLKLVFKSILEESTFPYDWEKSSVVPIHRNSKKLKNIYSPISVLPVFSKILERHVFN